MVVRVEPDALFLDELSAVLDVVAIRRGVGVGHWLGPLGPARHQPAQQVALPGGGAGRQLLGRPIPGAEKVTLEQVFQGGAHVIGRGDCASQVVSSVVLAPTLEPPSDSSGRGGVAARKPGPATK